ncbi:MAG: hypothetical protein JO256_02560 [Alphaproteobacteria bacterium]|nr:hypothetical protein [Alphaproteobacteria bacterium]
MSLRARLTAACTILAAFAAGPSSAAPLTSFGASLTANDLAALAVHAPGNSALTRMQGASFATSLKLSDSVAFDSGYRVDTGARFASFDAGLNPLRDTGSFLALADGGRYAGFTFTPGHDVALRLGAGNWSGPLDDLAMDGSVIGAPQLYDTAQVNSLLAGVNWNVNEWVSAGISAISSTRSGVPFGFANLSPVAQNASTQALQFSARVNLGGNWVTSAEFGQGLTQLRQQDGAVTSLDAQTFAITVAKRGVFGDDAVGLAVSRPAPGSLGGFGSLVNSTAELPPVMAAAAQAPETDFQLGYVTSFLGGRLALQTNAAYQVNPQGQSGTSAVSLLSRAKIKF